MSGNPVRENCCCPSTDSRCCAGVSYEFDPGFHLGVSKVNRVKTKFSHIQTILPNIHTHHLNKFQKAQAREQKLKQITVCSTLFTFCWPDVFACVRLGGSRMWREGAGGGGQKN